MKIKNHDLENISIKNDVFEINKCTFDIKGRRVIFSINKCTINGKIYEFSANDINSGPYTIEFNKPLLLNDRYITTAFFEDNVLSLCDNKKYQIDYLYTTTDFVEFLNKFNITNESKIKSVINSLMGLFAIWLIRESEN